MTDWIYPLTQPSQDKSGTRLSVRPPFVYESIGVDGQENGGVRPFPGFDIVHEFDTGRWPHPHTVKSKIVDVFPFDFVIGEQGRGYGFVYRVERPTGTPSEGADIFIDWWNSEVTDNGRWVMSYPLLSAIPVSRRTDPSKGRQMSVSVFGRLVYVFVEGEDPLVFWVEEVVASDTTYVPKVLTKAGPGKQPFLLSPDQALALGSELPDYLPETTDGAGVTTEGGRPGTGQIFLTDILPSDLGVTTALPAGLGLGDGTSSSDGRVGQRDADVKALTPGEYTFGFMLHDSKTGRRSAMSKIAESRTIDFDIDGTSGVNPINLYAVLQIDYDSNRYDQAYVYRSVSTLQAGGKYTSTRLHLDRIIDLEEFHTSNNGTAPYDGTKKQAVYYYELEDKELAFQDVWRDYATFDEVMPRAGASLWYGGTMLLSRTTKSPSTTVERRPGDSIGGLGEIRWSSLSELSPELVSPASRYVPSYPSNVPITFEEASPNVAAFSSDRIYMVRKESLYLTVQEVHPGYGVVSQYAADSVGSMVYFVTTKGVMTVDSNGRLDAVPSINQTLLNRWSTHHSQISVAHDPLMSVLYVHNPVLQETVLFWFNTGRVTELRDVNAELCVRGGWPENFVFDRTNLSNPTLRGSSNTTYKNNLVERAFFIQNHPDISSTITGFRHKVILCDFQRRRTQRLGTNASSTQYTLMPMDGNSLFTLPSGWAGGNTMVLEVLSGTKVIPENLWGYKCYVVWDTDPDNVGKTFTVLNRTIVSGIFPNAIVIDTDSAEMTSLDVNACIAISPVYIRVVMSPLGVQTEEGAQYASPFDFFSTRHANALGCVFSNVQGSSTAETLPVQAFRGLLYLGNADDPLERVLPTDRNGVQIRSILDDEGQYYAAFGKDTGTSARHGYNGAALTPGVEMFCSDLDFRLIAVRVQGTVLESKTTKRG